jgi:hypothetical protein
MVFDMHLPDMLQSDLDGHQLPKQAQTSISMSVLVDVEDDAVLPLPAAHRKATCSESM